MRTLLVVGFVCAAWSARAVAQTETGYDHGAKRTIKVVEVGDAEVEVHTAKAFRAMAHAAARDGIDLRIRSGFRSFEKQAALYRRYREGEGNLAARPGFSNHESGRALDIYITDDRVYPWLARHAATYGFHRTVPGEAWHWEYLPGTERPEPPHHRHHLKRPTS